MSKTLKTVNALLIGFGRKKDSSGWARVKFQLTAAVTKSLGWPDMPEGTAEWIPDVDTLKASVVELTPNAPELAKHAMEFDCQTIGDFMVQRKKKKAGKNSVKADKTVTEVACLITFADPLGCAKLEQYKLSAARSEMTVTYTPEPTQDELPGTRVDVVSGEVHATKEQRQAQMEITEVNPAPTAAEKKKQREVEREKMAELRKRIEKK